MASFAITFRLEYDANYSDRYQSVIEAIKRNTTKRWDETSSFYVVQSSGTAAALAQSIYLGSKLSNAMDTLVVIGLDDRQWAGYGVKDEPLLNSTLGGS